MIDVELSNIWGSVSLPDLLSGEKDLFDAHMQLRTNQPDGPDFLGWLNAPEGVMARAVLSIGKAAEQIAELGDTLVIVGSGDAPAAAQAAIRALGAASGLELIFAGTSLSASAYEQLCTRLEGTDFCLLLTAQDAVSIECGIASRAVRWLLDRRYGPEARQHIFVCAPQGSLLHTMAKEEGYTFLPQPAQLGCADSGLSPAALVPMAVAGIEPLGILEGAEQAYHDYDLRAFENPVWMYAGARHALEVRARRTEFLGIFEPEVERKQHHAGGVAVQAVERLHVSRGKAVAHRQQQVAGVVGERALAGAVAVDDHAGGLVDGHEPGVAVEDLRFFVHV